MLENKTAMKKSVIYIVIFAIIGLIIGYLIFGRIQGEYLTLNTIFGNADNVIESLGRKVAGLETIKQNILISGGAGGLLGFLLSFFIPGKK